MSNIRRHRRSVPSLAGVPPGFDLANTPDTPSELFLIWLGDAERAGVREPHAMTMATIGLDGIPNARMLMLKGLSGGHWCFAGEQNGPKGRELELTPSASLTFYWREQVRSVRVRGLVSEGSAEESAADFRARNDGARAVVLSGAQSEPVGSDAATEAELARAREQIAAEPDLVADEWTLWRVDPHEVEFWEGATSRFHTRLRYTKIAGGWEKVRLRP